MWVTVLLLSILEALYKKKNSFPTMSGVGEEKREEKKTGEIAKILWQGNDGCFSGRIGLFQRFSKASGLSLEKINIVFLRGGAKGGVLVFDFNSMGASTCSAFTLVGPCGSPRAPPPDRWKGQEKLRRRKGNGWMGAKKYNFVFLSFSSLSLTHFFSSSPSTFPLDSPERRGGVG